MTKLTIVSMILLSGFVGVLAYAQPGNFIPAETLPANQLSADRVTAPTIKAAVHKFNEMTRNQPVGKSQLPLTEDEVIAAIRGWVPEFTPGVTDQTYEKFQEIAESGELPADSELRFTTKWIYRGYEFKVWWIDLTVNTGDNVRYTYRIRDQKISSRKMSEEELSELKRLVREFEKLPSR